MNAELNPFEIKAEITNIFSKLENIKDVENYEVHYRVLDAQTDKSIITKLLFREISNPNSTLVKFLLARYCPKDELTEKLWGIIKNNLSSNQAKIFALDFLREIDTNWTYDECEQYFDKPDELIDADTRKILDSAIANPEVQIDFLDFIHSISEKDQIVLLNSLAEDYSKDELANMLIPVFVSMSKTETGKTALELLGTTKSQLAYHALHSALEFVEPELLPLVKKNINLLKLSGIREDNTKEFYKNLLKNSKPHKFCITYPDGHGNQAIIASRVSSNDKVQFVAIVIDDYKGVRDCFGFNEVSKFECNAIIERFYRGQRAIDIKPESFKAILDKAEKLSKNNLPYEYVCWRNIFVDIEPENIELNYETEPLSKEDFEKILQADFTDFWFLNNGYSDEFDDFLEIADKTEPKDFDNIIDKNIENIFFPSEYKVWTERIYNTAILKKLSGDINFSKKLFFLYNDKKLVRELFKNIIRKSLYEYYFAKNDTARIKAIEEMWVN